MATLAANKNTSKKKAYWIIISVYFWGEISQKNTPSFWWQQLQRIFSWNTPKWSVATF